MDFWATLIYAGGVVLSFGVADADTCETLTNTMIADITAAYEDPEKATMLDDSVFPDGSLFKVECRTSERPIPDEKYMNRN